LLFDIVVVLRRDARAAVLCVAGRLCVNGPVAVRVSDFALSACFVPVLEVSGAWAGGAGGVKKRVISDGIPILGSGPIAFGRWGLDPRST
jgi:hypothetical protein